MKKYHKINSIYKREKPGDEKVIVGQWSLPEFELLQDITWEFTEKVDGTNIRLNFENDGEWVTGKVGGRTDNADIPKDLKAALDAILADWDFRFKIEAMMALRKIDAITLYGEGYGPGIHGGGKYREDPGFVLFDVRVGDWWLDRSACEDIASNLGLDIVPVLGRGTLHDAVSLCSGGGFESTWGSFTAEGLVVRPSVPLFNRKMERIIAKVKVRDF